MLSRTAVNFLTKPRTLLVASTSVLAVSYLAASHSPIFAATLGNHSSRTMSSNSKKYEVDLKPEEWQVKLSPEQFRILRQQGTERAGTGEYDAHYPGKGVYECAGCGQALYTADTKFKSGCGWPAFFDSIPGAIDQHVDNSFGMRRVEIVCSKCGGHQGHVFSGEAPGVRPTDDRHCVNSVSIRYNPNSDLKFEGKSKA
ncbi:hypothetical protein JCM11641_005299 [Rhodosporidiobolus odoratus]